MNSAYSSTESTFSGSCSAKTLRAAISGRASRSHLAPEKHGTSTNVVLLDTGSVTFQTVLKMMECWLGFPKPNVACLPLVTAHNYVCSLIRTCCNTTRCGPLQERGMTTLVQHLRTSCVSLVVLSPTSNVAEHYLLGLSWVSGIPSATANGRLKTACIG